MEELYIENQSVIRRIERDKVMNREEFLRELERLLGVISESDRVDAIAYYNDYFDEAGSENEQEVIRELGSPAKVANMIIEDLKAANTSAFRDYASPEEDASYYEHSNNYEQTDYNKQSGSNQQEDYTQQTSYNQQTNYNQYTNGSYTSSYHREHQEKKDIPWILILIIAVLTFPLWIGIVAGLFGGAIGLIAALFGIVMALFGSGIGLTFGGLGLAIGGIVQLAVGPFEGVIMIGVGAILAAIGVLLLLLFVLLAFQWIPALVRVIVKACKGVAHRNEGGNEI